MMKGRITFTVAGKHPLLLLLRDYLIQEKKYALVPWSTNPDFCLYGAALSKEEPLHDGLHRASLEASQVRDVPTVILSSSSMLSVPEEAQAVHPEQCLVGPRDRKAIFSLAVESMLLGPENLVIRPFNVYGPDIITGVIPSFVTAAKAGAPLPIRGNGYQNRCFIHQDDFLSECGSLLGRTGVYTVGTQHSVSVNRLADSVWKAVYGPDSTPLTASVEYPTQDLDARQKVPQSTSRPYMSLHRGLWLLLQ